MDRPTSSKKSKLDIPSNAKLCDGLVIPKLTGPLPSVEERFEIYMIDTEPLLEFASGGFRLFVSRFTDQILIDYMSNPEFDVEHKSLANKYRWLYVIRQVWIKLSAVEKNIWEKNAKTRRCKVDDSYFDYKLHQAIQQNLYEQSAPFREKREREIIFKRFLDENADEIFITPSQMTFLVDFSPMQISPHVINFFKVCINLDYFFDTLFEIDAERTSELIKYAIFYSADKSDDELRMSLKMLMPSLKSSDQCDWIISELRKYDKHFDVREISLFPLNVLERFFRRFNPIDYGENQARYVRNQAIDLGVVDMVLDCLSFFSHQKARCKRLRPTHMDIAYFQIDYMTERSTAKIASSAESDLRCQAMQPDFSVECPYSTDQISLMIPMETNDEEPDFEYYSINSNFEDPIGKTKGKSKEKKEEAHNVVQSSPLDNQSGDDYYKSYASMSNLPPNSAVQPTTSNSGAINRRQKKLTSIYTNTSKTGQTSSKASCSSSSKFAKGTGYGSGSANSTWNVSEHVAKKKYEMEYVGALLKILQAFVKPRSPFMEDLLENSATADVEKAKNSFLDVALSDEGDGCAMIDEKLMQLLNRSCLRKTLLAYSVNGSLLDITQNKDIYEIVFGLLASIAQTGHVKAFSSLFIIDDEDSSSDDEDESADTYANTAGDSLLNEPCGSSSVITSSSSKRSGRRLPVRVQQQNKVKKDKEVKKKNMVNGSNQQVSTRRAKRVKKRCLKDRQREAEVERTNREQMDIFYFLFLDNWFVCNGQNEDERSSQPLLLNQLNAVTEQIDCYLNRMSNRSDQLQNRQNLSAEDLEMVTSDDEDRLRNLSLLSKLICAVIEKIAEIVLAETNSRQNEETASTSKASFADDEKEMEQKYCRQMKPLQFDTIPFFLPDSNQLAISYYYHRDITDSSSLVFGKNIRRITQEIVSLSSALPLSSSSSVFIRSCEERIHAAKMLITGPSGTPYANGCFEFDIHFSQTYPNEPMRVNLQTTGNGSVRFNPNLYKCGKVCLSVLNTWSGRPEERWNAETSSLLQVIVSLQSLVLVPEPYFNEPGFQNSIGTSFGEKNSANYNSAIRTATLRWAMLEALKHPSKAFADVIRRHFLLKRFEICKQIEAWISEERTVNAINCGKLEGDYVKLKYQLESLAKMKNVLLSE